MNEDKATRYHRRRRRADLAATMVAGAALVVLVLSGAAGFLGRAVERLVGADDTSASTFFVTTALFVLAIAVVIFALRFPLDVFREWTLDRVYGLERVPFGAWLAGHLRGMVVQLGLIVAAALVLRAAAWFALAWPIAPWWTIAAIALWAGHLAWTVAAPLVLVTFGGLRPMTRPALVERLRALGRRAGAALDVYEWRGGDDSRRAHAALGGVGRTRRVILSDTLLETLTVDEIEVVVAHELAHHVHGDVWTASAWRLVVLLTGMGIASLGLRTIPLWSAKSAGELAALPAIGALAALVGVVLSPVGYAISRWHERRADAFAIEMTGNPDAFLTSMRRLAASNLVEERPSRLASLFSSHPSIQDRMAAATIRARDVRGG